MERERSIAEIQKCSKEEDRAGSKRRKAQKVAKKAKSSKESKERREEDSNLTLLYQKSRTRGLARLCYRVNSASFISYNVTH